VIYGKASGWGASLDTRTGLGGGVGMVDYGARAYEMSGHSVASAGDVILLQDAATGDCYAWLVDGTTVIGSGFVGWRPGAAWVAQRGGDVNGDGNGDVLLRNSTTGESYIWAMSGTSVINSGFTGWATSADWQSFG
jgi:hypothetical protein